MKIIVIHRENWIENHDDVPNHLHINLNPLYPFHSHASQALTENHYSIKYSYIK